VKRASYNRGELVQAVQAAYDAYEPYKLDFAFLTLQCCYNSILEAGGGNDYKISHMGKAKLERQGNLPVSIQVTAAVADYLSNETDSDSDE
jgi:hypothetical protein